MNLFPSEIIYNILSYLAHRRLVHRVMPKIYICNDCDSLVIGKDEIYVITNTSFSLKWIYCQKCYKYNLGEYSESWGTEIVPWGWCNKSYNKLFIDEVGVLELPTLSVR